MFFSATKGFLPAILPAITNCMSSSTMVSTTASTSTRAKALRICRRFPFIPMDRNMPKMKIGKSGIINLVMTCMTTRSRSRTPAKSVSLRTAVMATPIVKARRRAVITPMGGSMSILK